MQRKLSCFFYYLS